MGVAPRSLGPVDSLDLFCIKLGPRPYTRPRDDAVAMSPRAHAHDSLGKGFYAAVGVLDTGRNGARRLMSGLAAWRVHMACGLCHWDRHVTWLWLGKPAWTAFGRLVLSTGPWRGRAGVEALVFTHSNVQAEPPHDTVAAYVNRRYSGGLYLLVGHNDLRNSLVHVIPPRGGSV